MWWIVCVGIFWDWVLNFPNNVVIKEDFPSCFSEVIYSVISSEGGPLAKYGLTPVSESYILVYVYFNFLGVCIIHHTLIGPVPSIDNIPYRTNPLNVLIYRIVRACCRALP